MCCHFNGTHLEGKCAVCEHFLLSHKELYKNMTHSYLCKKPSHIQGICLTFLAIHSLMEVISTLHTYTETHLHTYADCH